MSLDKGGMSISEWVIKSPLGGGYLELPDRLRRQMMREFKDSMNRGVLPPRVIGHVWLHDLYYQVSKSTWLEASQEPLAFLLPQGPLRTFYVSLSDAVRQVRMRDFFNSMEEGREVKRTPANEWLFVLFEKASLDDWMKASDSDKVRKFAKSFYMGLRASLQWQLRPQVQTPVTFQLSTLIVHFSFSTARY